jgi:hypothetical protein
MKVNMIDHQYGESFLKIRVNGIIEKTFDKIEI